MRLSSLTYNKYDKLFYHVVTNALLDPEVSDTELPTPDAHEESSLTDAWSTDHTWQYPESGYGVCGTGFRNYEKLKREKELKRAVFMTSELYLTVIQHVNILKLPVSVMVVGEMKTYGLPFLKKRVSFSVVLSSFYLFIIFRSLFLNV